MLQEDITTGFILGLVLVFARIGMLFIFMPGLSNNKIPVKIRTSIAILISLIVLPNINLNLPANITTPNIFLEYLVYELLIGLLFSMIAKFYFMAANIAGMMITMQSGLGSSAFFDPNTSSQSTGISSFIMMIVVVLIFVTDTHYLFLEAIIDSYNNFLPGSIVNIADTTATITANFNSSFILAFKIASPFLVVNFSMLVGGGILARLMPNFQVFFVLMPVQILIMLGVLSVMVNKMSEIILNKLMISFII